MKSHKGSVLGMKDHKNLSVNEQKKMCKQTSEGKIRNIHKIISWANKIYVYVCACACACAIIFHREVIGQHQAPGHVI